MIAPSASYASRVLLAIPALARGLDAAARRWRWLTTSLFDPYRPERHYMRGPARNGERSTRAALCASIYGAGVRAQVDLVTPPQAFASTRPTGRSCCTTCSALLLAEDMRLFNECCCVGIAPNEKRIEEHLDNSLIRPRAVRRPGEATGHDSFAAGMIQEPFCAGASGELHGLG